MSGLSKKSILSVVLLLLCAHLSAQPVLLSKQIKSSKNISSKVMIFEDITGEMLLEEVIQEDFVSNEGRNNFILPFSNHAFWFKMEFVKGEGVSDDWTIWFTNELTENLEFYEYSIDEGKFIASAKWDLLSSRTKFFKGQEPFFDFKLRDSTTVYIRLKSQRALTGLFSVGPSAAKSKVIMDLFGQRAFVNGLLIFRLLLVLTLGLFVIKDISFRAYSLLILIKTLGYWGLINALTPAFVESPLVAQKLNFLFYTGTPIGTIIFSLAVLPFFGLPSWFKKVLYFFLFLTVGVNILVQVNYSWEFLQIGVGVSVFSGVFIVLVFAYSVMKGLPIQKYYAIPFLLGLVSYLLMNTRILFQVQIPSVSTIAFFLFAAEIFIFIFFLGRIFRDSQMKNILVTQELKNKEFQSERLRELDDLKTSFFTNISHELKTPLTLISGPIEELKKSYPNEKLLKMIRPNINRLQQLINQILDIQKLEAGKQNPHIIKSDLAKHLNRHVLSFESLTASKGIELTFNQNEQSFEARYDEDKLNKIVDNLLSNAVKYTNKGGQVAVNVSYRYKPKAFEISVSDTGFGISEEDLPYIFDRFYQVSNANYQGSGVGLALVKELVSLLKGTIEVESELEKGTTFSVKLPADETTWPDYKVELAEENGIATKELKSATYDEPVGQAEDMNKELVLLVEDNADMQEYIKSLLEKEYRVIQAFNGLEGVEKANNEVPDIIVCDLMMPVMDGFEFSKQIRANVASSHVPIIMLTAKSSKESRLESFEIGIDRYLTKPFDADELKGAIKSGLKSRQDLKALYTQGKFESPSIEEKVGDIELAFYKSLRSFLDENYKKSALTVGDIAKSMSMSDTQLRRKLKTVSTYSPNEYLRKFRLQKAEVLLKVQRKSVSEAAFEVGFENLSYFSKIFQQEYGCLPSEFISSGEVS
ncbi:ATP-binding protein [uncultured Arcticibacterium sp.]|uniref:ATP-binding protein n=1 Tax=uncultured Arcticibacterium sp. TaxID=2173042 RepID=UPI0030FB2A47